MKKQLNETTQLIKDTLGMSLTVSEVETALETFENQALSQAPYFDGRLLDKIELLKTALGNNGNVKGKANS